jgi:flagellar hook-associated protein 3 FlgL
MRVTQLEMYRNFLSDIENLNSGLSEASRQVSSGKKLTQLSDSPMGSADLISLTERALKIDLYRSNADTGSFFLGVADSVLNEVNNLVMSIYTKGSQATSDTVNSDVRATLAMDIRSLRDQIMSLANSQARGRYIFAGSQVAAAPFVTSGDSVVYQGDSDVNSICVDDELEVQLGVPGSEAFNAVFESIGALLAGVDANDAASMKTALGQFASALSQLGQVRGQIGAKLSLLENIKANFDSQENTLKSERNRVEDADMTKAVVQLSQTQTALQAALSAGGAAFTQRNLFDILG